MENSRITVVAIFDLISTKYTRFTIDPQLACSDADICQVTPKHKRNYIFPLDFDAERDLLVEYTVSGLSSGDAQLVPANPDKWLVKGNGNVAIMDASVLSVRLFNEQWGRLNSIYWAFIIIFAFLLGIKVRYEKLRVCLRDDWITIIFMLIGHSTVPPLVRLIYTRSFKLRFAHFAVRVRLLVSVLFTRFSVSSQRTLTNSRSVEH